MTSKQEEMPPLPERFAVTPALVLPSEHGMGPGTTVFRQQDVYTADQMRSYAAQCVREAVERDRCAKGHASTEADARRYQAVRDLFSRPHYFSSSTGLDLDAFADKWAEEFAAAIREQK